MKLYILPVLFLAACTPHRQAEPEGPLFREALDTGLNFIHRNGAAGQFYMTEIMGSGVALFDYDNDGDIDVFLVQSAGESKLFRNDLIPGGTLHFTDVTVQSGVKYASYGMGAATGDYNNDGFIDLFVTGFDSRALFRNNGNGTFTQVNFPQPPGVWSTSASFFDYDRDGRLDLIVLSYVNFSHRANKHCQAATGERDYCTPRAYSPVSARLYRNDGGDIFTDVTERSGIDRALGPGLGAAAADLNDDGWPDLFVANDTAPNHVWINQRNGTFRELGLESGAGFSEDGLAKAGMGVAVGDADGDGREDLLVVNLMREGATLFRKDNVTADGLPSFFDVTRASGLYRITFPYTGFGAVWFDYDNDGQLDLFIANGAVTLREEQRGQPEPFRERNLLIHNDGNGKFSDASALAGPVLDLQEVTRGAAAGDLDNDGDVDLVIANNNGPARILLNQTRTSQWVQIQSQAIGTRISLISDGLPPLVRRVHTDSSYCSASDIRVHFGLGDRHVKEMQITWPDAVTERHPAPPTGRLTHLTRRTAH